MHMHAVTIFVWCLCAQSFAFDRSRVNVLLASNYTHACLSLRKRHAEEQRNALKHILPWLSGYLLMMQACVNFANSPARSTYLLDAPSGLHIP